MRLYKNNSEVVEFLGLNHGDVILRWVGIEFKESFFSVPIKMFKERYQKIPKKNLTVEHSPVSSKPTNNF